MTEEPECAGLLRRLAMSDDGTIGSIFAGEITDFEDFEFSDRRRVLVRLGRSSPPSRRRSPPNGPSTLHIRGRSQ